MVPCARH